jgi:PII-like signaling protein
MKKIIYLTIISLICVSCDLERDNPLDQGSTPHAGVKIEFASYSIYSDNNGDRLINKGEKIQLNVSLKNTGSSTAKGVKASFSTTSTDISGFSMYQNAGEMTYGDISAGSTKGSTGYYYDLQFTVSNTAVAGTQIPINITITDESNNSWSESFSLSVVTTGAKIEFASYSIYSDNNGDKLINKGEKIQLNVSLKNTGSSTARVVKASFSTTSTAISGFSMYSNAGEITYGDISAGSTKGSTGYYYDLQFTVSNTAVAGTQIPINISIVDESNNTWSSSFNVTVQ